MLAAIALAIGLNAAHGQALRPEVGKPLQQAAELLKSGRAKEALAKVRDAEAAANKTPAEQLMIDRIRGSAAFRAGDPATAVRSFEAALASGRLSTSEQAQISEQIAFAYSQMKDWNKTREWIGKAQQAGASNPQLSQLLSYVSAQTGDYGAIARESQAAVNAAEAAGKRPEEGDLLRLADALKRTGNTQGETATIEKLVTYYPKKDYFALYLNRMTSRSGFADRHALDVMRLKLATGNLNKPEEVMEMAQLALQDHQAAEAKKVLDEAFASGLLGKTGDVERQKRLLALATQRAASAPADLKAAEEEGKASRDGSVLIRTGLAYTGLGQYDKGIALIKQGIAKGGMRFPNDAQLDLGIALMRAGQKGQAATAFRAVGGTDGAADLARMWLRLP
ncbi:MAG: hypothetical protein ACM3KD_11455 [Hyphomicrobiaceae bacterium]